ncbi:uncharacterized protein [Rutidosis leptorrhynchoides]|uniref:uncharacterized protein n=1 Tax=Rutidosis leptorrhynchoides TaxID=125765 RepID=UPI003A99BC27
MKALIRTLPTLTALVPGKVFVSVDGTNVSYLFTNIFKISGETLTVYLAAGAKAISSVLIAERDGNQMPVYFVSKVLQHGEVNYNPMKKFVYALVHTTRRLRRYFQAHHILVLSKPEISGRMAKWAIEPGECEISYAQRNAIKGQILADFMIEFINLGPSTPIDEMAPHAVTWELFTDGASSSEGAGAGLILTNPDGEEHIYAICFAFPISNNEFEYEVLLSGLRIAEKMGVKALKVAVDSQLVANQLNEKFEARDPTMQKYLKLAEYQAVVAAPVEEVNTWMNPIINYLKDGKLPVDSVAAMKIYMKAPMYIIRDNVLYKKSFLGPLLRCVGPQEAEMVIREVHEGTCGIHSGFLSSHELIHISSAWSFHKWAIDLVGPFPDGRHFVIAVDFFTKWVEVKPLKSITGKQIVNFVWEEIVCRFGVLKEIVSDNGKQFAYDPFRAWCDSLNIKQTFSSVAHPQANGQVEVTYRDIVSGIKARLGT